MILAYTRDAAGAGDNFRIMNLFAMSYERHHSKHWRLFNFRGLFSLQGKSFPVKKKIKVFEKCKVAIHSPILRSTVVDLSVYGQDNEIKTRHFPWCDISVTWV